MGWGYGFDDNWKRDVGYGVPAYCDHPECERVIHRGLNYVCGGDMFGGEHGCGLYFCDEHRPVYLEIDDDVFMVCENCADNKDPHEPSAEHPDWMRHKLKEPSWAQWRLENESEAVAMILKLAELDNKPIEVDELKGSLNDVMVIKNHHGKRHEDPMKPGYFLPKMKPYVRKMPRIGRNEPCHCGSGKKYKKCCL
ncbi:SEC-C metal-binding domain-containing protein [Flavobacteriaceae bacterium]|nr:SEC-C metal-binding domain-containing protein [Flavobacteriaceae bacterium]